MKNINGASSDNRLPFSKQKSLGRKAEEVGIKIDRKIKEKDLQRQAEELLQYYDGIEIIRIPDQAYQAIFSSSNVPELIKKIISSWLKGLPDLTIIKPADEFNSCLCIEFKILNKKQSQGQKKFSANVNVKICRSIEDFQHIFEKWYK